MSNVGEVQAQECCKYAFLRKAFPTAAEAKIWGMFPFWGETTQPTWTFLQAQMAEMHCQVSEPSGA
eukprot:1094452-Amphidinium_carterae.1